jgi:hypothetical protein
MTFVINQFILAFCNLINSRIDAYRILRNKTIAHGINFGVYAVIVAALIVVFKMNWPNSILFCFSAFFNRQLSFDIPLNLRRHLEWYHQSTANPPAAWWDRVERVLFPDNDGKKIVLFYSIMWCVTVGINLILN